MSILKRSIKFLLFILVLSLIWWGFFVLLVYVLSPLSGSDGFYITVTAAAYTASQIAISLLILTMMGQVYIALEYANTKEKFFTLFGSSGVLLALIIMSREQAELSQSTYWWLQIFSGDTYGYENPLSAASAFIASGSCLAHIWLSSLSLLTAKPAFIYGTFCTLVIMGGSILAAAKVNLIL